MIGPECISSDFLLQREVMAAALFFFLGFIGALAGIWLCCRERRRPRTYGAMRRAQRAKRRDHGRRGIRLVNQEGRDK